MVPRPKSSYVIMLPGINSGTSNVNGDYEGEVRNNTVKYWGTSDLERVMGKGEETLIGEWGGM